MSIIRFEITRGKLNLIYEILNAKIHSGGVFSEIDYIANITPTLATHILLLES